MQNSVIKIQDIQDAYNEVEAYENAGYILCNRKEAIKAVLVKAKDGQKTYYFKK